MTITEIIISESGKCRICLNDEPAFWLYKSECERYRLREGDELTQEQIGKILSETVKKRAVQYAVSLLESMDRTVYQIREKLRQKDYPEKIIDETVEYLGGRHYLDDARYASAYLRGHLSGKSRRMLDQQLRQKGVAPEDIRRAWEDLEDTGELPDEEEQISRWMQKRSFDPSAADRKEKVKMMRFLLGKGFGLEEIKKAFDRNI